MNSAAEKSIVVADQPYSSRGAVPAPVSAAPGTLMAALASAAANPAMDVAKVKELFAMHKELQDREAEQAFADAMARAQASIVPIAKDRRNDHTKSAYATLAAIVDVVTPIVTAEGLAVSYDTYSKVRDSDLPDLAPGMVRVVAIVSHRGGHSRKYHLDGGLDDKGSQGSTNKTPIQAMGSTVTYLRRYLFCMIFNVATAEDDDGNAPRGKRLDEGVVADHLAAIDAASNEDELKQAFGAAWKKADEVGDKGAMRLFTEHKDARKRALGGAK